MEKQEKTKVIFRKFKDEGDIIAIFPEINVGKFVCCLSYQHIGQHSECYFLDFTNFTLPCKENEYQDLKKELEQIGYTLDVRKRISGTMFRNNCKMYTDLLAMDK